MIRNHFIKVMNTQLGFRKVYLMRLCVLGMMMVSSGCASSGKTGLDHYATVADESLLIYKEAERAYKEGDYELAQKNYEDFTTKFSGDVLTKIAFYYYGRSSEELGQKEKARDIYLRMMELFPGDFWAESAQRRIQLFNQ